eukprot:TRINITY_DN12885_c0_g1_i1.p1 TRINITY_DN12885_c0_g1~~TRINITY_DN12885_c0_g1_i1.p1  ORF type:complete len:253 (-),score=40.11 TRINITY_DN12885_c0_g1_i1:93-851(-)
MYSYSGQPRPPTGFQPNWGGAPSMPYGTTSQQMNPGFGSNAPYGTSSFGGFSSQPQSQSYPYGTNSLVPPPSFKGWHTQFYHQLTPAELAELQRWFTTVDRDRSGTITADELQGLAFGGRPLGYSSALKLVKVFDRDYSGSIDFFEYAALHKFITSMQNAFMQADSDRNGVLDQRELVYALQISGFQLTPRAVDALYRRHDKTMTQGVPFPMFLDLAADVALLKNQFEWLDADRDGFVTINLDQLIQMVGDI